MAEELTPAERAALAARGWYDRQRQRGEPIRDGLSKLLYSQLGAIYSAGVERCSICDAGGHTCSGCGHPVPHGGPVDYSDHGAGCPGFEQWHLERSLAEYALGVVQEWMRIIELERLPGQPRVTWQDHQGAFILGEHPHGDQYGRFRLKVAVESLPELPPIGPENDPAQIEEMREPEEPPGWVPRTWVDVRRGDRVRLPGTEHVAEVAAAIHMPWHVHPASRRDPIAMEWAAVRVTLNGRQYDKKPADSIEIELSPGEVAAIELLGWDNRDGLIVSGEAK